ncbi:MAG TPA: hypothetical protein VGH56_08595 [Solirubrobacteraceae bacterium]|jgi:hypothetical protein
MSAEFWVADAPVVYRVRKTEGSDMRGPGVLVVRCEDSDDNCQQALLEIQHDGDTLRLVQFDGDLDARKVIEVDQSAMRYANRPVRIWRRIWDVAMGGTDA